MHVKKDGRSCTLLLAPCVEVIELLSRLRGVIACSIDRSYQSHTVELARKTLQNVVHFHY